MPAASGYWKNHYVVATSPEEIERTMEFTTFLSEGKSFKLIYFEEGRDNPNILISQGSCGHAYIFAELAYLIHLHGYNVFVMPKHGGRTINELITRHASALAHISSTFSNRIGVFAEGLGCCAAFYLALRGGTPMMSLACLNGPAILTEQKFQNAIMGGKEEASKRRKRLLPFVRILAKILPG